MIREEDDGDTKSKKRKAQAEPKTVERRLKIRDRAGGIEEETVERVHIVEKSEDGEGQRMLEGKEWQRVEDGRG